MTLAYLVALCGDRPQGEPRAGDRRLCDVLGVPFGGVKQSGIGRELGTEGLEAFQETKHVHIESELAPKDWWYPYGGGDAPPHGA